MTKICGEDKYIVLFAGLHTEMACFKVLFDILRDSGWTHSLIEANIATPGIADSFWYVLSYLEHDMLTKLLHVLCSSF